MHTVLIVLAVLVSFALLRRLLWRRRWRHHGAQFFVQRLGRRLRATPDQQQALQAALTDLQRATQPLREEWLRARADLAAALQAETPDPSLLDSAFARQDAALQSLRQTVTSVLTQLHASLDARQRTLLAALVTGGHRHAC